MTRRPLTLALALALVVLLPGTALAHASFDVTQLPAGSSQDLVLRVPLERDADNDLVEVLVPGTWTVDACEGADGWTCTQDETTDGDTVVTLERSPGGPGDTERFGLSLTAPQEEGVYAFPTIQTYADGIEAAWIGEPGSDAPAPRVQVGDETTEVERNEDATPHTEDLATQPPTEGEATPDAAPTDEQTEAEPTEGEPTEVPTEAATGEDDAEAIPPGEGGPSVWIWVIGAVLLLTFAAAVAVSRRRTGGAGRN